jgi:hypothetical protein
VPWIFVAISSSIALVTILVGLNLAPRPHWHFTILDVAVDIAGGLLFGGLFEAVLLVLKQMRTRPRLLLVVPGAIVTIVLGVLAVFFVEGGAARALVYGLSVLV